MTNAKREAQELLVEAVQGGFVFTCQPLRCCQRSSPLSLRDIMSFNIAWAIPLVPRERRWQQLC